MASSTFSREELAQALEAVGITAGSTVFSHSNIGYFGALQNGGGKQDYFDAIYGAFQDVLTESGTLIVPTFTYSYCKGQDFSPDETPSTCGIFTEMIRLHTKALRSNEPIFSVAAIGPRARELTEDVGEECFGQGSFWQRLLESGGIICNLNFDAGSTFIHYAERCLNVPYRYDKIFEGNLVGSAGKRKTRAIFYCQDLSNPNTVASFEPFDKLAREKSIVKTKKVGRGSLVSLTAQDTFSLIEHQLKIDPYFLTASAGQGRTVDLTLPQKSAPTALKIPSGCTIESLAEILDQLPIATVSSNFDYALESLADFMPLRIFSYPTGTRLADEIVPEQWQCLACRLTDGAGEEILSFDQDPHLVAFYSRSFKGSVSKEVLLDHLYVDDQNPDQVPYRSVQNVPTWQLCARKSTVAGLVGDTFTVSLETSTCFGSMQVGEYTANNSTLPADIYYCAVGTRPRAWTEGLAAILALKELESEAKLTRPSKVIIGTCRLALDLYLKNTAGQESVQTVSLIDAFCQQGTDNLQQTKDLLKQSLLRLPIT